MTKVNDAPGVSTPEQENAAPGETSNDLKRFCGYARPFRILLWTERYCDERLAELQISPAQLEADKNSFTDDALTEMKVSEATQNAYGDHYLLCAHKVACDRLRTERVPTGYWALVACCAALDQFKFFQAKGDRDAGTVQLALFAQHMLTIAWMPKGISEVEHELAFAKQSAEKKTANENQIKGIQDEGAATTSDKATKLQMRMVDIFNDYRATFPYFTDTVVYAHVAKALNAFDESGKITDRTVLTLQGNAHKVDSVRKSLNTGSHLLTPKAKKQKK